jgi:hypothetical protein
VGRAGEHLTRERGAASGVGHPRRRGVQVKLTPIPGRASPGVVSGGGPEVEPQVAERLVGRHPQRPAHHRRLRQVERLRRLALEEQAPHPGQGAERLRIGGVPAAARPVGFLVELDALARHAAEHHGAEAPVPHRQRFQPLGRRSAVPQPGLRRGFVPHAGGTVPRLRGHETGRRLRLPAALHVLRLRQHRVDGPLRLLERPRAGGGPRAPRAACRRRPRRAPSGA